MLGEQLHNCNPVKYGYATCLPHKGGGVSLSALPRDATSKLAGLLFTLSLFHAERQVGKLWIPIFKVFWYNSIWEANPRSTDCEEDTPTTTPLHRFIVCPSTHFLVHRATLLLDVANLDVLSAIMTPTSSVVLVYNETFY